MRTIVVIMSYLSFGAVSAVVVEKISNTILNRKDNKIKEAIEEVKSSIERSKKNLFISKTSIRMKKINKTIRWKII